jgi:hypothetical protein
LLYYNLTLISLAHLYHEHRNPVAFLVLYLSLLLYLLLIPVVCLFPCFLEHLL